MSPTFWTSGSGKSAWITGLVNVPSPLSEEISMYDHLSTMVAIATVLSTKDTPQEKKFALLQGDFSGIQSFIFSKQGESNKHVAKTLRAKSFFVSMVTKPELKQLKECLNQTQIYS